MRSQLSTPVVLVLFCVSVISLHGQFGQQVQYFPQVVVGGGAVTDFSIHNPGDTPAAVRLELVSSAGVSFHDSTVSLPARTTQTVSLGGGQTDMQIGWARLTALAGEFTAAAFFQITIGGQVLPRVGVLPAIPTSALRFFAFVSGGQTNTGVAVANPSEVTTTNMVIRLVGKDGLPMFTGNASLGPRQHIASFLTEAPWFPGLNNFEGVVELESTQPVILLMLRSDQSLLSAAPVISPSLAGLAVGSITRDYLADRAVTKEKLSATGGTPGQLLSVDANGLVWKDLLPYLGVSLSPAGTDVFAVGNLGAGRAISATALFDTALLASSGTGSGVEGRSGTNDGVVGKTDAAGKSGVYGVSVAGIGVSGKSTQNDGVVGTTQAGGKSGVWGDSVAGFGVTGTSSQQDGVVGMTNNAGKAGVYGFSSPGVGVKGGSTTQDGVWGSTDAAGKSGVYGVSTPGLGVTGRSGGNHGVAGYSSSQNSSHAGVYGRNTGAGPAVMAEGDLHVTGAFTGNIGANQGAPFPRPAWTSGWIKLDPGEQTTLTHDLGGNWGNYVVQIDEDWGGNNGITNFAMGYFESLNDRTIKLVLKSDAPFWLAVRARIWVCK